MRSFEGSSLVTGIMTGAEFVQKKIVDESVDLFAYSPYSVLLGA